jgi:hypothetical protein
MAGRLFSELRIGSHCSFAGPIRGHSRGGHRLGSKEPITLGLSCAPN